MYGLCPVNVRVSLLSPKIITVVSLKVVGSMTALNFY